MPVFRAFSRIGRARNQFEYPNTDTGGPAEADLADAIKAAAQAKDAAGAILDSGVLTAWR